MNFPLDFDLEIISVFFGVVFSGWISKSLLGCSVLPLVFGPIQLFCCNCCFHHSGFTIQNPSKITGKTCTSSICKICTNYKLYQSHGDPIYALFTGGCFALDRDRAIPVLPVQSFSKCPREASTNKFCGLAWRMGSHLVSG